MAGAVIGTEARIACGVLVNAGAVMCHCDRDCAFTDLGVGACIAGGSVLAPAAYLHAR